MWPPAQHCALSEFTLKLLAHSFKLNLLIAVLIIYTTQRLSLFNARFLQNTHQFTRAVMHVGRL